MSVTRSIVGYHPPTHEPAVRQPRRKQTGSRDRCENNNTAQLLDVAAWHHPGADSYFWLTTFWNK